MPRKKTNAPDTSASVKLEATAKASYVRQKKIMEVIPPDVTRAKTGAWLDLISPLTEWAGLKGDELRFKRTQLRLQREDVLSKIVESARHKIGQEKTKKPIPNKFLIPFLEKASLEDLDSALIEMWASLLASAATTFSSHHVHFVSIISQLSPKQGTILKSLIGTESAHECEVATDNVRICLTTGTLRQTAEREISRNVITNEDDFGSAIDQLFSRIGIEVVGFNFENLETNRFYSVLPDYSTYRDDDEVDYSILEAVGLIRRVEVGFFDISNWALSVTYYHLTELGFYFAKACGIIRSLGDEPRDEVVTSPPPRTG